MKASILGSRLAFGVPAVIFGAAGVLKLCGRTGTQPRLLQGWFDDHGYALAMAVVGGLELLVGIGLIWRRSRRGAAFAGLGLLAAFSALIAFSATDERFISDCGCGILSSGLDMLQGATPMLLRNLAIAGILVFVTGTSAVTRLFGALGVAVVGLGLMVVSTRVQWFADREIVRDLLKGTRVHRTGWTLPDLALRDVDGREVRAHDVLEAGDGLMLFSRTCPHCESSSARWTSLAGEMAAKGGRLVLIEVGTDPGVPALVAAVDSLLALPRYQLIDHRAAFELGVRDVPHFIEIGPEFIVTYRTAGFLGLSAFGRLRELMGADEALATVARSVFGESDARMVWSVDVAGVTCGRFQSGEVKCSIVVARNSFFEPDQTELALGLDARGRIVAGRALVWQVGLTGNEPSDRFISRLQGLTCTEAAALAAKLVNSDAYDAPIWNDVHRSLDPVAKNAVALGLE